MKHLQYVIIKNKHHKNEAYKRTETNNHLENIIRPREEKDSWANKKTKTGHHIKHLCNTFLSTEIQINKDGQIMTNPEKISHPH